MIIPRKGLLLAAVLTCAVLLSAGYGTHADAIKASGLAGTTHKLGHTVSILGISKNIANAGTIQPVASSIPIIPSIISVNATSDVPGVVALDNGTISTIINGVPMNFVFNPNKGFASTTSSPVVALARQTLSGASQPNSFAMQSSTSPSIVKTQSGLVASDSLTNETETQQQLLANPGYWNYQGDAPNENASYSFNRDTQGLHIAVQAPSPGTWAGFFAESPNHAADLWSSLITNPIRTTTSNYYENGLYVQTSNGLINYVTCSTLTNTQATVWVVISVTGNFIQATNERVLWMDNSANQPLTRDCTIVTNGNNYLKVYLDGNPVYTSSSLSLQMPSPFNAYLEPETSDSDQMLVGSFQNYFVTLNENASVANLPNNAATVNLSDSSGNVLASSPVSGGNALLNVGQYLFPLSSSINVYDSSNALLASSPESLYGGDAYSFEGPTNSSTTVPSAPSGLAATAASSSRIDLSWNAPSSDGGSPITGYMIERSLDGGTTWSTLVANTGSTTTAYSDMGLSASTSYAYRVSAINSVGTSAPSNTATATTSQSNTGSLSLQNIKTVSGTVTSSPYEITLPSFDSGAGTNKILIVGVHADNNYVESATFGGLPLKQKIQSFVNNDAEFWYLQNPSGIGDIVVKMTGPTSVIVGAYSISGVNETLPLPTATTNHNTSADPNVKITTKYPNSWVLDLPSIYGGVTLGSPTCNKQWDINILDALSGGSSSALASLPGAFACNWTASNTESWDDAAVEVKAQTP